MRIGIKRTCHLFAVDLMGDARPPTSAEPTAWAVYWGDKSNAKHPSGLSYVSASDPGVVHVNQFKLPLYAHPPTSEWNEVISACRPKASEGRGNWTNVLNVPLSKRAQNHDYEYAEFVRLKR